MKKQILSVIALGMAAASFAQVYLTEKKSMPNVMSVTNEGKAVGYAQKNQPFYIWNPVEDTFIEIGGVSPGDGVGGAARFSIDGNTIAAPMFSADIPVSTDWVHSTIKEMEGMYFSEIEVVSGDQIYAIGSNADGTAGAIIRTTNSGTSWRRYDYIQREDTEGKTEIVRPDFGITCFGAINHRYLVAGGSDGRLYLDGGSGTWKETSLPGVESETPVKRYIAMNYTYELVNEYGAEKAVNGCIAAELEDGTAIVWYTVDGATSFQPIESVIEGIPTAVSNNKADFFMATTAGKVYKSEDGGKTWTENFTLSEGLQAARMVFTDENSGVILCDKVIYATRDGGKSWEVLTAPEAALASWKDAAWNSEQLMVVGTDGTCLLSNDFDQSFRKQAGFEGELGAVNYKVSARVFNVLGFGGEAYRMTAVDKLSGYTAGLYNVETDTWTPLKGSGYSQDDVASSPWNISGNGQYVVGTIRDLDNTASVIATCAAIWDGPEGLTVLPNRFKDQAKSARANAVNFDGSIVAGWQDKFGPWFATLWIRDEDGNYTEKFLSVKDDFDPETFDFEDKAACMEYFPGYAQVITPDGKWVGGQHDQNTALGGAWIWSEETGFKVLTHNEESLQASTTVISADGTMAAGWDGDSTNPWIWTEAMGTMPLQDFVEGKLGYKLEDLQLCSPYAMSPNGRYICGYAKRGFSLLGYVIDLKSLVGVQAQMADQVKAAIYPNPVAEELHVDLPFDSSEMKTLVALVDMQGRTVACLNNPAQSNVIDVRSLTPGMYLLTVSTEADAKSFKVIVK